MRGLSASLTAAQKAASRIPYVETTVENRVANVARLRWASQWTDGAAQDDEHDAVADDTYLHRARVRAGNPQYERDAGSGWAPLNAQTDSDHIAIAAIQNTRVIIFYNRGTSIYYRESSDQGGSFGAETLAVGAGSTKNGLAVAYKTDPGDLLLVYADGAALKAVRRTSGTFGGISTWTSSANSLNGVDVELFGDFHIVVTGTDSNDNPRLWGVIYGDGFSQAADTWSALDIIAEAEDGSNVSFLSPSLALIGTHRLFFVEKFSGSTAYARPLWTWFPPGQTFASNTWREPVPFDLDSDNGVAITGHLTTAYLSRPDETWSASTLTPETDLSDDVLAIALELRPNRGRATVTLRNDDGRYNDLPGGSYSVITHAAQLEISPGYVTTEGQESSAGLKFWIDGWEHVSEGGNATLVLHASDAWSALGGWRARRQHHWPAASLHVVQILTYVFARAGIDLFNVGSSSVATTLKPDFTIHPGESAIRSVARLMAMVPDVILVRGPNAYLWEPLAADASAYSYATPITPSDPSGDHPLSRARYASHGLAANRVQVFGDSIFGEDFDWPAIDDQLDRLRQVFDLNLDSAAEADNRADDTLRQETLAVPRGQLLSPPHCGQEIYDVIDVTDSRAGLSAEKFRVQGLDLRFDRRKTPVYEQRLVLGKA